MTTKNSLTCNLPAEFSNSSYVLQALLYNRLPIATIVNAHVLSLEDAAKEYDDFDKGIAAKFTLDSHGSISA